MPRYIDAEALIRDLIDNRSFYPVIVKNAIENAPTEDVVPRSEVEKAKQEGILEVINKLSSRTQIMMSALNAEIAQKPIPVSEFNKGAKATLEILFEYLAELKKKYIGEVTGNE